MIEKHSFELSGHRTSISIEREFWDELKNIALNKNISIRQLIQHIDNTSGEQNLSSCVRVFVLTEIKNQKL